MKADIATKSRLPDWTRRVLASPWPHLGLGIFILLLDLLTGPYLAFPIFFVVPVSLSAWFYRPAMAYALAVLLPLGRFLIAEWVDQTHPLSFSAANALIRVAVLLYVACLVARTTRQTKELRERLTELVTICAWSRTVEYKGEWISFEDYLKRRFNIDTSHGISPAEAKRASRARAGDDRKPDQAGPPPASQD